MDLDPATARAVQELADVGARHGRPPEPVPEADPWEDDDPLDGRSPLVAVEFAGVPSVVVRLHRDGQDVVVVEDGVDLDVPRQDTPAVVEALLTGRARRREVATGRVLRFLALVLHNPLPADLVVDVTRAGSTRTYAAPLVLSVASSEWLVGLPPHEAHGARGAHGGRAGAR